MARDEHKELRDTARANARTAAMAARCADEELSEARAQLERKRVELDQQQEGFEATLANIGATIASQLDYEEIVRIVTDAATQLSGAQFGAFFYTKADEDGKLFTLNYVSGADPKDFAGFGHPRATPVFGPTFEGKPPVRVDDILVDPRYGQMAPHYGMPKGHLPVRSYLAVSVISRSGGVIGGLFFGHAQPGIFTERSERIVCGIAAYAAIAIDNAKLYEDAQREIARRQRAEEALRQVDRRKDEFLALLAHELRNPLAPIRQVALLWAQGKLSEDKLRWSQQVVERQSRHMAVLLDDLLDISRIKRGSLRLRKEWIELSGVVDAALETVRPVIDARRHDLNVELTPPNLQLDADPVRLTQVLANLLNNAAKYTEPGGRITLRARAVDTQVEICVADNGIGIAPEQQPRVFDIFFQSEAPLDRGEGGLGLGLALVKGISNLHGGEVAVHSAGLGAGTEFTIRLPTGTSRDEVPGPAPLRSVPDTAPRQCILIVDDNRDSADSLALFLRRCGHDIHTAYSGEEALVAVAGQAYDWIVMDIGMPKLNGYETARRIREMDKGRTSTLVALTGWGQDSDRQRALEAGFQHHFTKPVNPAALAQLIETESIHRRGPPSA